MFTSAPSDSVSHVYGLYPILAIWAAIKKQALHIMSNAIVTWGQPIRQQVKDDSERVLTQQAWGIGPMLG